MVNNITANIYQTLISIIGNNRERITITARLVDQTRLNLVK